jgi:preprotein translocase subunit SecB
MEVSNQVKLKFHGVDILNVQFKAIDIPRDGMDMTISCIPRVFYPESDRHVFRILMEVVIKDERYFVLSINAVGHFELNRELDADLKKQFVNINAPAIMFPYVRSFITTLTANMGRTVGTLIIPTQFFKGDIEEIINE